MKMKHLVRMVLFLPALLLIGCATSENYKNILETWVGASESKLVSTWGVPDGVYEIGDIKYLSYKTSISGYVEGTPATYTTTVIGNRAYTTSSGGTSGYSYDRKCETTFSIRNGTVFSWSFKGNDCTALDPDN